MSIHIPDSPGELARTWQPAEYRLRYNGVKIVRLVVDGRQERHQVVDFPIRQFNLRKEYW